MRLAIVALLLVSTVALADNRQPPPKPDPIAVVVVIDRSKMMQGTPLVAAKEMVEGIVVSLRDDDLVAVVAFENRAVAVAKLQPARNRSRIKADLTTVKADGQPNHLAALAEAATQLLNVKARRKHVVVLSNGNSSKAGVAQKASQMRGLAITISTIGTQGADRELLSEIATAGDGRLYMVADLG